MHMYIVDLIMSHFLFKIFYHIEIFIFIIRIDIRQLDRRNLLEVRIRSIMHVCGYEKVYTAFV